MPAKIAYKCPKCKHQGVHLVTGPVSFKATMGTQPLTTYVVCEACKHKFTVTVEER